MRAFSWFGTGIESWVLTYLLNSLWQVPLVFLAAQAAARLARPAGPQMEHRVWVGALLLEPILPLCNFQPGNFQLSELGQRAWGLAFWFRHASAVGGQTRIVLGVGTASGVALPWHTAEMLAAVAVAYLCGLLYFAGRLGWGVWSTEAMRRGARPLEMVGAVAGNVVRFQRLLGIDGGKVRFATSAAIAGPATVGVRRQTLLLPPGFLEKLSAGEVDAVLAHEFAHMQRWDFAKNLLYGIVALPVAYHPLLWLTRARLAETRELVCDAMAAEAVGGRESYARSLLRLARMLSDGRTPRILHAIGILDANIFERRVMYLTRRSLELTGARRLGIAAACTLVALVTCTSALALRMDVKAPSTDQSSPAKVHVKATSLTFVNHTMPVYPAEAKKERVSGKVVLDATIARDGTIAHLRVVSGPAVLQQSALDAVRQWRYKPYLLNGETVAVQTTVNVIYTLAK